MAGALIIVIAVEVAVAIAGLEMGTVIRAEDDDRVFVQPFLLQAVNHLAQISIQRRARAQIIRIFLFVIAAQRGQIRRRFVIRVFFLRADRTFVVLVVVLMMRLDVGNRHKERLLPVVLVKEFQRQIRDTVRAVALEVDAVVVFVKHIPVVAVGRKFQHVAGAPEAGVSAAQLLRNRGDRVIDRRLLLQLAVAGQMPFADIGGLIARLLDIAAQRLHVGGQHHVVAEAARLGGVFARLEQRAAGAAHRLRGKRPFKLHTFARQLVKARRDIQLLAVTTAGIGALLIRKVKDDIRAISHFSFSSLSSC